ncbi:MAG: histidine--tRNA ligase [Candidatus Pacebacteria bacterium]|nr:histidine--tRNA ligase [Candidatus Paceibacterota bacterium]
MSKKFKSLGGMHDVFGEQYDYFDKVREVVSRNAKIYGFKGIETPVIEETGVFTRGVGEQTDIVEKEMYTFKTKGGEQVSLRPEGTAPIMRSFIEHSFYTKPQPVKFYYFQPFFRHERQQAGRYRQFWQFGFETIGKDSPIVDAQIIVLAHNILKELGIKDALVKVNNLGCERCRDKFKSALKKYLKSVASSLCSDCKKRMKKNPLRVLDCKECSVKEDAPQIMNFLCKKCSDDFRQVLELLDEVKVSYDLDSFLVRGLDYYNGIVYEIVSSSQEKPLALGGGGRYNKLSVLLGSEEEIPATGMAIGVERVVSLMKEKEVKLEKDKREVFIAQLGDLAKKKALKLFEDFKKTGLPVFESFGRDSLKSQLSRADRLGVNITIIIGKEEALAEKAIIRDMDSGKQEKVDLKEVVKEVKKKLKENKK